MMKRSDSRPWRKRGLPLLILLLILFPLVLFTEKKWPYHPLWMRATVPCPLLLLLYSRESLLFPLHLCSLVKEEKWLCPPWSTVRRERVASTEFLHASFRRLSQAKVPPDHPKKMFCKRQTNKVFQKTWTFLEKTRFSAKNLSYLRVFGRQRCLFL